MRKSVVGSFSTTSDFENLLTIVEKCDTLSVEDAREIFRMIEKKEILSGYNFPQNHLRMVAIMFGLMTRAKNREGGR